MSQINTKPKLLKIETHEDIFCKCSCCSKDLKHAYHTDQGILGKNCFLSAIGYPVSHSTKSPILPIDQLESMMSHIIIQLNDTTPEAWISFWMHYYGADRNDGMYKLDFIEQYGLWFRTSCNGQIKECHVLDYQQMTWIIHRICQTPSDIIEQLRSTNAMNQLYRALVHNHPTHYNKIL